MGTAHGGVIMSLLDVALCTDGIPESTFVSEYYLRFRGVTDKTRVVPLVRIATGIFTRGTLTSRIGSESSSRPRRSYSLPSTQFCRWMAKSTVCRSRTAVIPSLVPGANLVNAIGRLVDSSIAVSRLLYSGHLLKYSGLKFVVSHGGAALPFYARNTQNVTQWAAPVQPTDLMDTLLGLELTSFNGHPEGAGVARRRTLGLAGRAPRRSRPCRGP